MKIFIISGKARHGKDTISQMIKDIYEEKGKKTQILSYGFYLKEYAKKISNWNGEEESKPRELLQQLGTTIIREKIDNMFFIKRMVDDIKVYSYFFDVLIISDARLKQEVTEIKKQLKNVFPIRIIRPNFNNNLSVEQQKHITEIDLDDYDFKYVITNDKSLKELKEKVEKLIGDVENEY